jgi:hypothetical protein
MTSFVSNTVAAIVAALNTPTPVAPQVARVRLRPIGAATATAVVVRPVGSNVTEALLTPGYPVSWTTAIAVECYARSSVSTAPDVAVDSLLEAVYARLMADTTLGGVVLGLQPKDIAWDFDVDGEQTTCATLVLGAFTRATPSTLS